MLGTWKEFGKNGLLKQKMHTNSSSTSRIIVLDSIRSMQNVWAIMRNCDGAWFEKVLMCWHTPSLPRNDIRKTALWAESTIDWEYYEDVVQVLKKLQSDGYKIYSVELDERSIDYKQCFSEDHKKVCLVMWNEITWVKKEILDMSDKIVSIKMEGKKASLNVSVAAWIVMYAFVK